jgi:putative ABC transport system permease protein
MKWPTSKRNADLERELRADLELEEEEQRANGLNADEAKHAALRAFGNPLLIREQTRSTWGWDWLDSLWRNVRYGMRTLLRTPGFALVAIAVMTLGISTNVALFTVVRGVLLKPLPFHEPERLIQLYEQLQNGKRPYGYVAGGMYAAWKKNTPSVEQMAVYGTDSNNLSDNGGQLPERIRYAEGSWDLFPTLGVQPELGRLFTQADDSQGAPGTVMLTHSLWMRRYGGDHNIIGKTIQLNTQPYTVVGVLPAWFMYPDTETQLWAPIYHEVSASQMREPSSHNYFVVARLKPGATIAQALSEVDTVTKRVHQDNKSPFVSNSANARSLLDGVVHDARTQLYVLFGATGCVLLIACLNVANLLIARSASRRKEISIRASLGGSRWKLLWEQVTESVLLAVVAGMLGVPLAWMEVRWLMSARADMARMDAVQMDGAVILFAVGVVAVSAVLAGILPGITLLRGPLLESLQDASRGSSRSLSATRLRKVLLVTEVAVTMVLLISAGLLLKSYRQMRAVDIGCTTQNMLTMRVGLAGTKYDSQAKMNAFYSTLLEKLHTLPGVTSAALASTLPGQGYGGDSLLSIPELPQLGQQKHVAMIRGVDPGYFRTMQIPLLSGRFFEDRERLENAHGVIVSESFAREYFPQGDALGKHLQVRDITESRPEGFEIVGVVGDTLWSLNESKGDTMYFPLYGVGWTGFSIAVRADHNVESMALPVQKLIAQMDPGLPVANVLTMEQSLGKATMDANVTSMLVLAFAIISLVLAAVGLYGVLSYLVTQRTGEIGIRMALGAQRQDVLQQMLVDGLQPALIGVVVGLVASAGCVQLIRSMLYGTRPLDPTVFVAVTSVLLIVAAGACFLPAWHAARLDPMQALRNE